MRLEMGNEIREPKSRLTVEPATALVASTTRGTRKATRSMMTGVRKGRVGLLVREIGTWTYIYNGNIAVHGELM